MGEIKVKGRDVAVFLRFLIIGDIVKLRQGQILYTHMCYENGTIVDDILIYKLAIDEYLLVVNASNKDKDFAWIQKNLQVYSKYDVIVEDLSEGYAQIAIQGPLAENTLQALTAQKLSEIPFFSFVSNVILCGKNVMVSRTGYTGEDGFEIYMNALDAGEVWDEILRAGGDNICPVGLGARDTLRFEAKLPLYGHEISDEINSVEAGMSMFISFDSGDFIGKDVLLKEFENGPKRKLVEFTMVEKGIPRQGYVIEMDGVNVGYVTSGGFAPTLGKNIGLALIDAKKAEPDSRINVVIREKPVLAYISKKTFYKKKTRKK